MNKEIESVRKTYNNSKVAKSYTEAVEKVGLWNSEKIMFEKYISKDAKILDLGCGAGRTTINLYKEGYKNITGLDISDKFIDYAKNYCKTNNLDIEFINQRNFEILEHVKREDICEEGQEVKEFSGSTWFWVIRKIN